MEKPTVFISYKRDKSDIVNKLEVKIGGRAEIKRDTKEIGAWESITTFMKRVQMAFGGEKTAGCLSGL